MNEDYEIFLHEQLGKEKVNKIRLLEKEEILRYLTLGLWVFAICSFFSSVHAYGYDRTLHYMLNSQYIQSSLVPYFFLIALYFDARIRQKKIIKKLIKLKKNFKKGMDCLKVHPN